MSVCPFVHLSNSLFLNLAACLSICLFTLQSCPLICLSFICLSVNPYRQAEKTDELMNREIIGRHIKARYDKFLQSIYCQHFFDITSARSCPFVCLYICPAVNFLIWPLVYLSACSSFNLVYLSVCLISLNLPIHINRQEKEKDGHMER
jgi:hypothetical protein